MLCRHQVAQYIRDNPDWDKTIVKIYNAHDTLIKILKFPSRAAANEFVRECKEDFIVIDYGCN